MPHSPIKEMEISFDSQSEEPSVRGVFGYSIVTGFTTQKFSLAGFATTDAGGCRFGGTSRAIEVVNSAIDFTAKTIDSTIPSQIRDIPGVGRLRKPIAITVEKESGSVLVTAPDLDITESGMTLADALAAFFAFFQEDLEHWQSTEDQQLTEDALALKKRYLDYVA